MLFTMAIQLLGICVIGFVLYHFVARPLDKMRDEDERQKRP